MHSALRTRLPPPSPACWQGRALAWPPTLLTHPHHVLLATPLTQALPGNTGHGGRSGNCRRPGDMGAERARFHLQRRGAQAAPAGRPVQRRARPLPLCLSSSFQGSLRHPAASSGPNSSGRLASVLRLIQTSSSLFINSIPPYQPQHREEGRGGRGAALVTEVWGRGALISLLAPRGHPQVSRPAFTCSQSRSASACVTRVICVWPPLPLTGPGSCPAASPLGARPAGCERKSAGVVP